jgi:Protein of unknown function (DUF2924)
VSLGVIMKGSSQESLLTLRKEPKNGLEQLWMKTYGVSPPAGMRRGLLITFLAYRIQEQEFGSLSPQSRNRLRQLVHGLEKSDSKTFSMPPIKPGTRLVRRWGDQVHLVNVLTNGFEYRGLRYQSLSAVARLITGTQWSGPLFFGWAGKSDRKSKGAA